VTVIELAREPPPAAAGRRARRRRGRAAPSALVVAALLALGLAGGTPPLPGLAQVGALPVAAGEYALAGGVLYEIEPGSVVPARLAAYRVPDGRRLWRTTLSGPVDLVRTVLAPAPGTGGVVLARSGLSPAVSWVSALDARTGRVLWGAPSKVDVAMLAGGVALLSSAPNGPSDVLAVDLNTGTTIWRRAPAAGTTVTPGRDRVLLEAPEGGVQVLAARYGTVLAAGSLPASERVLLVTGDAVYTQPGGRAEQISRYDPAGGGDRGAGGAGALVPRWSTGLPAPVLAVTQCGAMLCVQLGENGIAGVDPDSGAVLWRDRALTIVDLAEDGRLVTGGPHAALVDTSTGRELLPLAGAQRVGTSESGAPLYRVESDNGGGLLAVLEVSGARLVPVGALPGSLPDDGCQAAGGYLTCRVVDRLIVWRYPALPT
jgi:hypothetical protein